MANSSGRRGGPFHGRPATTALVSSTRVTMRGTSCGGDDGGAAAQVVGDACGVSAAACSRAASLLRPRTSSSSASNVLLVTSSKAPALAASTSWRGGLPGLMMPESIVFVSRTTRTRT
jgi:hypothetical protein